MRYFSFTLIAMFFAFELYANEYFIWDDFKNNYPDEVNLAHETYQQIKVDVKENTFLKFKFTFISNNEQNLIKLENFIKSHYNYQTEKPKYNGDIWYLNGITCEIPFTDDNLLYWVLDMYRKGYNNDCRFNAYSKAEINEEPKFSIIDKIKNQEYSRLAQQKFNNDDLSGAYVNWSLSILINPKESMPYYSRAIIKAELLDLNAALLDLNQAIELKPDFVEAILYRGNLKNELEDYHGAIEDFNKVLTFEKIEKEIIYKTLYSRANTKFEINDRFSACEDWKKAYELGADYALDRINQYCK